MGATIAGFSIGRIKRSHFRQRAGFTCRDYTADILAAMRMRVLPITLEIAELPQSQRFEHSDPGDPGDRLIATTAMHHRAPIITADEKLRALPGIRAIR